VSGVARRDQSGVEPLGRIPRPVARAIAGAGYRGAVATATVRAAGHVTHTALALTTMLTAEEERLIGICPLGEARYRMLVDQFTAVAATEIAKLGVVMAPRRVCSVAHRRDSRHRRWACGWRFSGCANSPPERGGRVARGAGCLARVTNDSGV